MESINTRKNILCSRKSSYMLSIIRRQLKWFCIRIRRLIWRTSRPKVIIKRFGKLNFTHHHPKREPGTAKFGTNAQSFSEKPIRIATFNVAMFSLAPAISKVENEGFMLRSPPMNDAQEKSPNDRPKSILKQRKLSRSNMKVSINLPDNEISLAQNKLLSYMEDDKQGSSPNMTNGGLNWSQVPVRSPICFPLGMVNSLNWNEDNFKSGRSILEILREVDADIWALQDVKAEEEKGMKPLSDLANALGMYYVFAESWAPEYGTAILSKWHINRWKIQKIANNDDFRNVLKATIDVPWAGEVNCYCTQLDHLDENWRMKQIGAFIQANDSPHILAGGLNSLTGSDYSSDRWTDIVKYYEDMGKPIPKVEVMKYLKGKGYADAKDFSGDCEPLVIIAKGQNVQGTCKYGTRVDYILSSSESQFKFVPGSYSVISSKGTSDHHIVKVDIIKQGKSLKKNLIKGQHKSLKKLVKDATSCYSRGTWRISP